MVVAALLTAGALLALPYLGAYLALRTGAERQTEANSAPPTVEQAGAECEADEIDCFFVWTGCASVGVAVNVDDNEIGLQRNGITNAAESRLRAANVFSPSEAEIASNGVLLIRVDLVGSAFEVSFDFYKPGMQLRDDYGFRGVASTWRESITGTHGGNSAFVMEVVRRLLDQFMNDYLRVNAPACEAR